ncbi:hypothetical protein KKF86_03925 [bacterium]|nr:hypothetical protein [bacterium]
MEMFYTTAAEWSKFILYVILSIFIIIGLWKKYKNDTKWANWIHFAIFTHFIIGAFYSGIRMLTTDEVNDMLIRRIFACEAWFNFACAAFYFIALEYRNNSKISKTK